MLFNKQYIVVFALKVASFSAGKVLKDAVKNLVKLTAAVYTAVFLFIISGYE